MKKLKLFKIMGTIPKRPIVNKWNSLFWSKIRERVFKLQKVIYKASLDGNIKKVRRFQHLLVKSTALFKAKLLAVRRVTQDNTGKCTAGVDGVKNLTPDQRLYVASILSVPHRSKPLRRVWIPKPGTDVMVRRVQGNIMKEVKFA